MTASNGLRNFITNIGVYFFTLKLSFTISAFTNTPRFNLENITPCSEKRIKPKNNTL